MSELERKFAAAWAAFAPEGAEPPVREMRFHPIRRWRFDFAWPEARLAVEVDGGQWLARGGRHNTDADRRKLNAAAVLGWRVLRYSGAMLDEPETVIREVVAALEIP
ncbi:MAG TPA: DUF559 domain-containing protein [Anaerolineae bacterium]|nr:DUF559 domain-containing protein [Anaerolineae bacterium]